MGLKSLLARAAVSRAHVLVVATPSSFTTRVALERALLSRGWVQADSPADADVLAVCGHEFPQLTEALQVVWDAMPGPRVRVDLADTASVPAAIAQAARQLLDTNQHIEQARHRAAVRPRPDQSDMDMDMDMGHGDMDMAPGGIPLAEGAEDRDGLEMDVLHLPLGPVLPYWPSGLVLHCALHGDVAIDVEAEVLAEPARVQLAAGTLDGPGLAAARACDAIVSVLALAGWPVGAGLARRVRDACMDGDLHGAAEHLDHLRRTTARSLLLRWMLRGIGRLDAEVVEGRSAVQQLVGDVYDRLVALLDRVEQELLGSASPPPSPADLVDVLPALVDGLELASVRLVVASLGLEVAPSPVEVADA